MIYLGRIDFWGHAMKTIKGPGIFLAQFADNQAPFNSLEGMAHWAAQLGFVGVQIPSWDRRLFDLKLAAESRDYCEEILGILDAAGLKLTELSTHLQGQLVASILRTILLDGLHLRIWQAGRRSNRNGP